MMNRMIVLSVIALSCLFAPSAKGEDYPTPPVGYEWKACNPSKGALLLPTGWHFREVQKGDAGACFVSRESTAGDKEYTMGLSINVLKDLPHKKNLTPSEFARAYMKNHNATLEVLKADVGQQGPFWAHRAEARTRAASKQPILHTYTLLIANNKTGTLFLVLAEAPETEWAEAWRFMEPILKILLIDDAI